MSSRRESLSLGIEGNQLEKVKCVSNSFIRLCLTFLIIFVLVSHNSQTKLKNYLIQIARLIASILSPYLAAKILISQGKVFVNRDIVFKITLAYSDYY